MSELVYSNKYEVQEEIARGGMGVVYRAWDRMLERTVALKVIHSNLADDSSFVERFFDEARKMALLHHPHIIQIYSVEQDQEIPFLVMEYFPGSNLKTYLQQHSPLSVHEAIHIISQVAHALGFTHQKGVIHRDIKPANILLDDALRVKLTDFGIARAFGETSHTVAGQLLGTVKYMSPEQAREDHLDGRSDLYALGMLFFELLTGTNPRSNSTAVAILSKLVVEGHIPELQFPTRLNIPYGIQQIIWDLLQFRPEDRILNAEILIERLKPFLPDHSVPTVSDTGIPNETVTLNLKRPLGHDYERSDIPYSADSPSSSQAEMFQDESARDLQKAAPQFGKVPNSLGSQTHSREPQGLILLRTHYVLPAMTLFLIMAMGGYAWYYFQSQPDTSPLEHTLQITKKPDQQISLTKDTVLEGSGSNVEGHDQDLSHSSSDDRIKTSRTPPDPKKSLHAKTTANQHPSPVSAQSSLPENPTSVQNVDQVLSTSILQNVDSPTSSSVSSGLHTSATEVKKEPTQPHPEILALAPSRTKTNFTDNEKANSAPAPHVKVTTPDQPSSVESLPSLPEEPTTINQEEEAKSSSEILALPSLTGETDLPKSTKAPVAPDLSEEKLADKPSSHDNSYPSLPEKNGEDNQGTILAQSSQETLESDLLLHVEQLQQAIIEKNWDALERMSRMSESRRYWLETLYTKFQSIQIDIAQVTPGTTQGQATIHFTQGIRSNGEVVTPNSIGGTIKITIPKNGDQWGQIVW